MGIKGNAIVTLDPPRDLLSTSIMVTPGTNSANQIVFVTPRTPASVTIWQGSGKAARVVLVLPGDWTYNARTFTFTESLHIPHEITTQMQANPSLFSVVVGFPPEKTEYLPANTFKVVGGPLSQPMS